MQIAKISFVSLIGQAVIKLTNWLVLPLQRFLPRFKHFDLPCLAAAYLCSFAHITLLVLIGYWAFYNSQALTLQTFGYIALGALLNLLKLFIYMLSAAIIIQVILSWMRPSSQMAWLVQQFTQQISAPFISPIKKRLPAISGLDFSPFIALLMLQVASIMVTHFFS